MIQEMIGKYQGDRREELNSILFRLVEICKEYDITQNFTFGDYEVTFTSVGYSIQIIEQNIYINKMCQNNIDEILYQITQNIENIVYHAMIDIFGGSCPFHDERKDDIQFLKRKIVNYILFS